MSMTAMMTLCTLMLLPALVLATSLPPHQEELSPGPSEAKSSLRGQAAATQATLFQSNSSTSGVSIDLGFLTGNNSDFPKSKANDGLEDQVNNLFKMTDMRGSMTKEQFEATPFGKSVKKIRNLITNVMMPKVTSADKLNRQQLATSVAELRKCGSTKNTQVARANVKKGDYLRFSPMHKTCRASEEGIFNEKTSCWEEEVDKKKIMDLKCHAFDMVKKQTGDQQASRQIMNKAGGESTQSYVDRITATVCGSCSSMKDKKGPYEPYKCGCGLKCKFDRARDECSAATHDWEKWHAKCKDTDKRYSAQKNKCDSLQDQMDDSACKRAVEMKDACEAYAECHFDKEQAHQSLVKMVSGEEVDRKAEWKGLQRMGCLIDAFSGGKVSNAEINKCKSEKHTTDHLTIEYPGVPSLVKCEVPRHYPNTPEYKADNFALLPALAKGKLDSYECTGLTEISTVPKEGSPKTCVCSRVTMNGPFSAGPLVKCENCIDVRRSLEKNSCPDGTKLFSPRSRGDWKTFLASAAASTTQVGKKTVTKFDIAAPNFIVDVTRPQNGCGGCEKNAMTSDTLAQRSWTTSDNSAWWLSGTGAKSLNGDYHANCFMNLAFSEKNADKVTPTDNNCNYHSKSYYCQAANVDLTPKKGSPDGCTCKLVTLNGKYSAGALIKCTGCNRVSKSMQTNSCPVGTKLFSPRSREDWKTFIASAGRLASPHWIIDVTQAQNGCGGCKTAAMNSNVPAQATWRTADNSPWFLRSARSSAPNKDYTANCYMSINSAASEDAIVFGTSGCGVNSNAYYCQPAVMKKKAAFKDAEVPEVPEPVELGPPPAPEAGGKYENFKCAAGAYTGLHDKCGHFEDLSEAECIEKCAESASAGDDDTCDKKTGLPDCVASVYDKENKVCILHRSCRNLVPWEGHMDIVTQLKPNYHPKAKTFKLLSNRICKGEPYTRPEDKKRGLKGLTGLECWKACHSNAWTGDKLVEVEKCAATAFYVKSGYCDFFVGDECKKTRKKKGVMTHKKISGKEEAKKDKDKDEEDEDEDEDEEEEEEEDE